MALRLESVCKSYGPTRVVKSVSLDVETGEFVVFVGPSGCGKSTILRMIAGLESITSGSLFIGAQDVTHTPPSQRGIAMVFQSYALYPHLSVYDNIAFSLQIAKLSKAEIKAKVTAVAESLQLTDYLGRLPKALSGGQRQRVAIGRAIVRNPKVFLFDEPLSNLDAALRTDMRVELAALHAKLKSTMVYVTHDQVEAMTLADRIVVMNHGCVEQVGNPMDLYLKPQTPFVAGFIGSPNMNLLDGALATRHGVDLFGIRPEDIEVGAGESADKQSAIRFPANIERIEKLGADTLIYAESGEHGKLLVKSPGVFEAAAGGSVELSFPRAKTHLFKDNKRVAAAESA